MKHNTYSRIVLYIRALYFERFKVAFAYCVAIGFIYAFIIIFWSSITSKYFFWQFFFEFFCKSIYFMYFLFSMFGLSSSFSNFHNKKTIVFSLSIPVSQFEKYIALFLFCILTYLALPSLFCFLTHTVLYALPILMGSEIYNGGETSPFIWFSKIGFAHYGYVWLGISRVFGFFFVGALVFKKHQFLKTLIFLVLLSSIYMAIKIASNSSQVFIRRGVQKHFIFFDNFFLIENEIIDYVIIFLNIIVIFLGYFRFKKIQYH